MRAPGAELCHLPAACRECWRELAPPDPVHAELEPFRTSETKCELPLVPGELRILTTGKAVSPDPAGSTETEPVRLNWIVRSVLRSRIGSTSPAAGSRIRRFRSRPPATSRSANRIFRE
ncbi:MAG: hypothetical protein V8T86_11350 [Victivallis sp.]